MMRRPPRSPPFPYPTLSRSRMPTMARGTCHTGNLAIARVPVWQGDRKSTRLNSSHRCISDAVFCFKTKSGHFPSQLTETVPMVWMPNIFRRDKLSDDLTEEIFFYIEGRLQKLILFPPSPLDG